MKKQFTLSVLLVLTTLFSQALCAQNEKRYSIEMSFTFNGKTIKTALASASYSINREVYEEDSSYAPKNIFITRPHQLNWKKICYWLSRIKKPATIS
ncbi:hypothetical protein [Niabella hibiscisoli]|uniref:hypothetical protein n=1 Tax=Niabella hibiscisoli TaxID=1825928 RepID=UPI001F0D3FA3|nr:hypothetical protein [Niabella hibiscisoli]MCH5717884.1 hypothetical protein [Niabella hibiscisoli]